MIRAVASAGTLPAFPMGRLCELMAQFEGIDQPGKWPGASSGITVGCGFDLGFHTEKEFREAWGRHLSEEELKRLATVIGITGERAESKAGMFRDITVTREQALEVLSRTTAPKWLGWARRTFPGMDRLPAGAQLALVSLVGNRGTDLSGQRRVEMRRIRDIVGSREVPDVKGLQIAGELRSMKRLWPGDRSPNPGLRNRREKEARLCEE